MEKKDLEEVWWDMFHTRQQDTSNQSSYSTGEKPDFEFGLFLDGIIFDRIRNKCEYVTLGENRFEEIEKYFKARNIEIEDLQYKEKNHHFSRQEFESMVLEVKERIKAGEIFQGVISNAQGI